MSEYPKFKYHKSKEPILCQNSAEEEALGKEWADDPNEAKGIKPAKVQNSAPSAVFEELKEANDKLEEAETKIVELQEQLEAAEDHIETLEAQLEEASKNDQRGDDGKFKSGKDGDDEVEASEAAVALAEEYGIDLRLVKGTGADGNIIKSDVEAYLKEVVEGEGEGQDGETEE